MGGILKDLQRSKESQQFKCIRRKEQVRTSVVPLRNSTGRVVGEESEMAGLLNRYFASTFTQEESGELPIAESFHQGGEEGILQKIQVGVEEVKEELGNLREDKATESIEGGG